MPRKTLDEFNALVLQGDPDACAAEREHRIDAFLDGGAPKPAKRRKAKKRPAKKRPAKKRPAKRRR